MASVFEHRDYLDGNIITALIGSICILYCILLQMWFQIFWQQLRESAVVYFSKTMLETTQNKLNSVDIAHWPERKRYEFYS